MRQTFFVLLAALPLTFACKKKDTTPTNPGTAGVQNTFSLKKDGTSFSPADLNISLLDTSIIGVEALSTAGQPEQNSYFAFFEKTVPPGTYPVVNGSCQYFLMYYYPAPGVMYDSFNGTFTVTSNDTVNNILNSTFQFTMHNDGDPNDPVITNGVMNVHYPE